jgi:hypothetical protein
LISNDVDLYENSDCNIFLHIGSITSIKNDIQEKKTCIVDTNNSDLFTGCGYGIASDVICHAGVGLQSDLYDRYGIPKINSICSTFQQPNYAEDKKAYGFPGGGRGFAILCEPHDMADDKRHKTVI